MDRRAVNWMIATAGVAVAIYFAFIIISNYQEVGEAVSGLQWPWLVVAILLSLLAYVVRALRWNYYLDRLGVDMDTGQGLRLYFAGLSMLITPAMISGVVKVGLVKARLGVELKRTLPIVVVERLTDLVGMLVLAAAGVIFFGLGYISMAGTICFLVVVLAMVRVTPIREAILGLWGRIPGARRHVDTFRQLLESAQTLLDRKAFGIGSLYSLVSWGLVGLTFYMLVLGFDMELSLFESLFIFAFPAILGIMSQTPGGLGVEEMGMETLLLMKEVELADATALVLVFRLVTLWLGLGTGLVVLSGISKEMGYDGEGTFTNATTTLTSSTTSSSTATVSGPDPSSNIEPGSGLRPDHGPRTDMELEPLSEPHPDTEPEPGPEPELQPELHHQPDPELDTEPESEPVPEPDTEPGSVPGPKAEPQPITGSRAHPEPEVQGGP